MTSPQPHHLVLLERLLNQEQQELFTDLEVCLQDGTIHASRNLLAGLSDPFRQMLGANMVEGQQRVLKLPHVTMDTWKCVFQFYFSNRNCVNGANAVNVLEFSHMYQLEALQEHCYSYLRRNCSPTNCLEVWRLARVLGLHELTAQSLQIIRKNFLHVGKQDFVDLTFEELCELLGNGDLVTIEDEFCHAVLRWIARNNPSNDDVITIFNHVQLQKLSSAMLTKLAGIQRLQESTSISTKLAQEQDQIRRSGSLRVCPTIPSSRVGPGEVTVVVGNDSDCNMCIYTWFPGSQGWSKAYMGKYLDLFACFKHRDTIIITGGWLDNEKEAADTTLLFDLKTATLSRGRKLRQARYLHGMAAVDDMVFVVGGRVDMEFYVSCIERYDAIGTRFHWKTVGNMSGHIRTVVPFRHDVGGVATVGRHLIISLVHKEKGTHFLSFNADTNISSLLNLQLPFYDYFMCSAASFADEANFLFDNGFLHRFSETRDGEVLYKGSQLLEGFRTKCAFTLFSDCCSLLVFEGTVEREPAQPVRCFSLEGQRLQEDDLPALPEEVDDVMGAFLTRGLTRN